MPRNDSTPFTLRVAQRALYDAAGYEAAARRAAEDGDYKRASDAARSAQAALGRALAAWTEADAPAEPLPADPLPA